MPRSVATPSNQIPLHAPLYSTFITTPSSSPFTSFPFPKTMQFISPLTSFTPTRRRPSPSTSTLLLGAAHLTRTRSVLGNVPCTPQPSANPAVDESEDSSSASCVCVYALPRDGREEALRVTCGSAASSHEPGSSSMEDRDAKDCEGAEGGNMRSLMLFERQRGTGMDSYNHTQETKGGQRRHVML